MTRALIIDGLTFYGACNVAVFGFLGWLWVRDWWRERRFEREYRQLCVTQYRERVR